MTTPHPHLFSPDGAAGHGAGAADLIARRIFISAALGRVAEYSVFIPTEPPPPGGWPLVLVLHGAGRNHRTLADDPPCRDVILKQKLALLFPDAGTTWYLDRPDTPHAMYRTFLLELLLLARKEFPVSPLPARTGICGWSMGGYGAVRFAQTYPEQVRAVASGIGLLDYPNPDLPVREFGVDACFGADSARWPDFNCMTHAERLRDHALLLVAARDAWDYPMNLNFRARLDGLAIPHAYREIPGAHAFPSVRACLPEWLEFMAQNLA